MKMKMNLMMGVMMVGVIGWGVADAQLSVDYYQWTCPQAENIIREEMARKQAANPTSAAGTLRIYFHDCFVEGCDASVLISSTPSNRAEREAEINLSLPGDGFDAIARAKSAVEAECPGIVSCADVLSIATRDLLTLNTALLRAVPGLNELGKLLLGPVAEQVMLLENIGTSVLVTNNQAVLAHELGHLKCDHGIWLTFANILTLGAYAVPGLGTLIAQSFEEQLFRWLRAAELTCDRAALLVAQDPKVVISVLMKLAGGCPSVADQLNVDAFLEQARSYDKASSSPIGWYLRNAQTRQLSHPLPVLRAREIDQWARNREYKALIARASRINSKLEQSSRSIN